LNARIDVALVEAGHEWLVDLEALAIFIMSHTAWL
jgi:hypothetical protein